MNDFDETTAFLGHWGRYQQIVFFALCACSIPNGSGIVSLIFVADTPSHHCLVPEVNLTQDWLNAIIPVKVVNGQQELSRCSRYRLDVVRNLSAQGFIPGRDVNLTDLEEEGCVDGWSYSRDIYQSTIVSEFDLVCSDQWKEPFTVTVSFLGVLFGSFFTGQLSDRFGRKPVFFATMASQTTFALAQVFSPSWTVFSILSFLNTGLHISTINSALILGLESLSGNVRVLFLSLGTSLGLSIGNLLLPFWAYFLRDWKSLVVALALPGLLYIPLWWFIPESPRWLVSQGRVKEAEAIVRKAAKTNKVEAPQIIFQHCDADDLNTQSRKEKSLSVFDLMRTSNIRATTFIVNFMWLTVPAAYFSLSLNSAQLSIDPYISSSISVAVEVPATIFCWLAMQYFPRRLSTTFSTLLGGVSLFFIPLVPQTLPELAVALEMLGKYGFTVSMSLLIAYTAELYPTALRCTVTGTCATISTVGNCFAPYFLQLQVYSKHLLYFTLGSMGVIPAFAALFLPETFGQPLPETIQQMHKIEGVKCPCITRKEKTKPPELLENKL